MVSHAHINEELVITDRPAEACIHHTLDSGHLQNQRDLGALQRIGPVQQQQGRHQALVGGLQPRLALVQ